MDAQTTERAEADPVAFPKQVGGVYFNGRGSNDDHHGTPLVPSLLAPRNIPHAWAYVGETSGRLLIGFQPAGAMEAFFHEMTKMPDFARDPKLFSDHGMEIVGPPISLD